MPYVRIPSFQSGQQIVDREGRFTAAALRSLNDAFAQLGNAINIIAQIPEIQQALLDLDAATLAAQAAATAAQNAADTGNAATALANSYVTGATLTSSDAGSSATISISAHSRVYATNPLTTVAVSAGTVTGLAYDTRYYIYYDQPSRAGGTVSYMASTTQSDVAQVNDRHSVGYADTPMAGQPDEPGYSVQPPGANYGSVLA